MFESSRAHLNEVEEGYFEHFGAALTISGRLAKAAVACALHAIIPGICTRTASRCVAEVHQSISTRTGRAERTQT